MSFAKKLDDLQFDTVFQPIVCEYQYLTNGPWWKPAYYSYLAVFLSLAMALGGLAQMMPGIIAPMIATMGAGGILLGGWALASEFKEDSLKEGMVYKNPNREINRGQRLALFFTVVVFILLTLGSQAATFHSAVVWAGFVLALTFFWSYAYLAVCDSMTPEERKRREDRDARKPPSAA